MSNIDPDDYLDSEGPSQVPVRTSRFQPKISKLKPKPKAEPDAIPLQKQEDSQPSINTTVKTATEPPPITNNIAKVETKTKAEDEELKDDPMEEDDDGEDRVVREIDVFFTPPPLDTNTQLYVLQYPLRPCWRPYDLDERCQEVRVKPKSSQVEVDLSLNDDPKNYDAPDDMRIKKQTLSSSWKPPSTTGYAVGILMGNKLHLNPVHAVVQLRPSMEHLKSGGLKKKKSGTQEAEAIVKSEVINEKASVGPSKKQGKLAGISNEQNADDAESWVPLEYHGIYSDFSSRYREKMAAQESSPIQFSMSPYDYVDSLCPGTCTDSKRAKGPSRRFLLSLPLEERFKMWLCEGPQVHRFNALKHLAPDDSNEDVLGVLRQLAHLVQGLWVPKSSLLCQGVQALARDYVLFLFSKNPVINYIQLDGTKLPKEHLYRVLNLLAVERPSFKNWKFKEPTDVLFIKLHPDILREQERVWESHGKQITDAINGAGKSGPGMRNSVKPSMTNRPGPSVKPDQGAKRDVNGSGTMIMSDETQEVLRKALLKLFHTQKVCSFQLIRQSLRDMAVAKSNFPSADARAFVAAAHGVNTPQEDLQAVISEVAINVHGVYVSKSSSEHPEYDPFRKVVINLFCAKEPKAKLRKADIVEAAKIALKRNVPTNEYKKVLSELCVLNGGAWVLKSGDGNPK